MKPLSFFLPGGLEALYLIDTFWDVSLFLQYAFIFAYLEASAACLCWFLNLALKNAINLIWIDFIFKILIALQSWLIIWCSFQVLLFI